MKQKLLILAVGFLVGGSIAYLLGCYVTADEREIASLYPVSIGLRISHDIRVLNAIQSNDLTQASSLLKQEIDSSVNTLQGLGKFVKLDERTREAVPLGQNALK